MNIRRSHPQHKDSGAALLLAIGTVMMIGVISASLASAATSSLQNRTSIEALRNREYAADGAIEQAITSLRGSAPFLLDCTAASGSMHGNDFTLVNGVAMRVDWVNTCSQVSGYNQRNVMFSACLDTPSPPCASANVIIRAQVNFEPAKGPATKTFVQSWSVNR